MMNVAAELRRYESLTTGQLHQEHLRVTGERARSNNRPFLIKRILWNRQAATRGGLTERARARANELARDQDLRVRPPQAIHDAVKAAAAPIVAPADTDATTAAKAPFSELPPVGSVIMKQYCGRRLQVQVVADGFVFEQQHFKSLSAVARHVTGANWNGRLFFGVATR